MTTFLEPSSIEEACRLLNDDTGAKVISGGTALVLMMRQGLIQPETLISLGGLSALSGISQGPEAAAQISIGATTTLTAVSSATIVKKAAPILADACRRVGNVRVRNVATIGGNIAEADYASDPPSVLIALDASCTVQGPSEQRSVLVRDLITGFYTTSLGSGEIITGVTVPVGNDSRRSIYLKYVSRSSEDRPCVGVAAVADFAEEQVTDLTIVVGAVADVPQRLDSITTRAIGGSLDPAVRAAIADDYAEAIDPMEDARGSAWYRRRMIRVFVRRALESLAAG